jgi:hypothetical protein
LLPEFSKETRKRQDNTDRDRFHVSNRKRRSKQYRNSRKEYQKRVEEQQFLLKSCRHQREASNKTKRRRRSPIKN